MKTVAMALAAAAVLAVGNVAMGQEEPLTAGVGAGPTEVATQDLKLTLDPYANHQFRTTIKDSDGADMSVTRAGMGFNVGFKLSPQLTLNLGVLAEYSHYEFDNIPALLGVNRKTIDAMILRLAPGLEYKVNDQWAVFGGMTADISEQFGADCDKSDTYGGFFGARYRASDTLTLVMGVTAKEGLADHCSVTPMVGVNWKIAEDLMLTTSGANLGAEVKLTKKLSRELSTSLAAGYERRSYRLNENLPGDEGVFRDARVPVTASLEWKPWANLSLRMDAGAVVFQRIEFDDRFGGEIFHREANCAPFAGISATYRF